MIDSSIPKQNEVPGQMVFVNECTSAEKQHMDIDDIEETRQKTPRNFKVQILEGQSIEIKIKVKDQKGEAVREMNRFFKNIILPISYLLLNLFLKD